MQDSIIRDSTPKGSALLAYGESPRHSRIPAILALAAGMFACTAIAITLAAALMKTLPVPLSTAALLYAAPRVPLPGGAPDVWKRAKDLSGPFPAFYGFRSDAGSGDLVPFAIVPRFAKATGTASWAFHLLDDGPQPSVGMASPTSLAGSLTALSSSAWLRIWPQRLLTGQGADSESLFGVVTGNKWSTDATFAGTLETRESVPAQNMVAVRAVPDAWPIIESVIRDRSLNLRLSSTPSVAYWGVDADGKLSVGLHFDEPIASTTMSELAASAGVADRYEYMLEDGTFATELRTPSFEASTTADRLIGDDVRIAFDENDVMIGDASVLDKKLDIPEACKGEIVAVLDGKSLNTLLENFKIQGFQGVPERITWLREDGKVVACW